MSIPRRQDIYYQAQAILSRRDHSEAEVRFKLRRKGFAVEDINTVITWLKNKKFLNDELFATKWLANTLRFKAVGRRWIRFELQKKGIDQKIVEKVLENYSVEAEQEQKEKAKVAWLNKHPNKLDPRAVSFFLASRGFSA